MTLVFSSSSVGYLGAMLEPNHKQQPKPKTIPEFKDALHLISVIWSALSYRAIDNAAKHFRKRLQTCM